MLVVLTAGFRHIGRHTGQVYRFTDMRRVIVAWIHPHARGMRRGHRRHHGDRKDGKHGGETCDHAAKGTRGSRECPLPLGPLTDAA